MGSKPRLAKTLVDGGCDTAKEQTSHMEETRFRFLGTKVLDEMKILARLAAPSKTRAGDC